MHTTLLIMAAGLGSRYGGNKQIDRIGPNGEILLEYSIYDALAAGFDKVVFVIKRSMGESFRAMIGDRIARRAEVHYAYQEFDSLPGGFVPPKIQQLTGITTADLQERGLSKTRVCRDIGEMVGGNTLLLAYNAHFDLSFLFYMLLRDGDTAILKGKDKLDLLTVYRDRHSYPHRLCSAIEQYGLSGKVVNSHRAVDDVLATVAVMEEMEKEKDDLERYVNLFGYNPKYGIEGKPIGSVTYKPHPYNPQRPLYEL